MIIDRFFHLIVCFRWVSHLSKLSSIFHHSPWHQVSDWDLDSTDAFGSLLNRVARSCNNETAAFLSWKIKIDYFHLSRKKESWIRLVLSRCNLETKSCTNSLNQFSIFWPHFLFQNLFITVWNVSIVFLRTNVFVICRWASKVLVKIEDPWMSDLQFVQCKLLAPWQPPVLYPCTLCHVL